MRARILHRYDNKFKVWGADNQTGTMVRNKLNPIMCDWSRTVV